jgi:phospho-N-acetylmuramoyl-pentapeptide-transferase
MLLLIFEWLKEALAWKIPTAFLYFSTRMMCAAATALLLSIFLGPRFIKKLYELKIGQPLRYGEECPQLTQLHGKKKDTPTMGGVLILFSMSIALLLWMDLTNVYTWILLATTLFLGCLGGIDDYLKLKRRNSKGLKGKIKMVCQVGFSSLIALYLLCPEVTEAAGFRKPSAKEQTVLRQEGKRAKVRSFPLDTQQYMARVYVPFKKEPVFVWEGMWRIASFCLIVLVITGASNAVNLTDGLDGLASGCLVMVSLVLAVFAFFSNHIDLARYLNILYIEGSGEIAVYLFALAGAALGFLWYNSYPAQVFMGDTGSLALGGIVGVAAVLLRREMLLALVGAIFVAETLSVILQVLSYRYRNKKRIFLCTPLHHHFEYKGWPETKVVTRFWIVSLLFAMIGVASLKFQ